MRRKLGIVAAAALVAASLGVLGCSSISKPDVAQQTVMIQVENDDGFGISTVRVRAWIVDVDEPLARREPIELGPAPTDNEGVVRFTYPSTQQPYICGFQIEEIATDKSVAQHAPNVTDRLSDPAGQLTVRL
ncbi:MAG TPA: hypothetical protein VKU85_13645 [bacterium]|nr:hypothetical protein [bacterium]